MHVLGYVGSPRPNGNTATLVNEVLRGAASAGASVLACQLNRLSIRPCQACEACKKTGVCCIADDMAEQYEAMARADAIVIGTPVYWWGPSAQTKAFLDRWYAVSHGQSMAGKRMLLVCTHADSEPETAELTVSIFENSARYLNMGFRPPLTLATPTRGAAAANAAALTEAFRNGRALAE